jgi:hypothetical protein
MPPQAALGELACTLRLVSSVETPCVHMMVVIDADSTGSAGMGVTAGSVVRIFVD